MILNHGPRRLTEGRVHRVDTPPDRSFCQLAIETTLPNC